MSVELGHDRGPGTYLHPVVSAPIEARGRTYIQLFLPRSRHGVVLTSSCFCPDRGMGSYLHPAVSAPIKAWGRTYIQLFLPRSRHGEVLTSSCFCHGAAFIFLMGRCASRLCFLVPSCSTWYTRPQLQIHHQRKSSPHKMAYPLK